ncbi:MAG: methionyl-tRNA formyltransferase [Candidatus Omnitrophota bacterium]|nr:methionyl-tRNA formyltransferase [Candidatus Omnitrophota bacterium]
MKIVFFGSSHFAVPALEALIKNHYQVSAVVTQPDKKKGRHLHLASTDVKSVASQAGLEVFQPEEINSSDSIKYLKNLCADLFVVVAYGQILAQAILNIPKIFSINIHASLLPKYRGAAPINWAIIKGEKSTGVTVIKLVRKMDAGPMLLQKEIPIDEIDDSVILEDKLRRLGAELLVDTIKSVENKTYQLTVQDEEGIVMAPKLKRTDGCIDWNKPAVKIYNLVRGCLPWPGAFTHYKGKLLKICETEMILRVDGFTGRQAGEILSIRKDGLLVMAGEGALLIKELQLEGGNRMTAKEFVQGHKINLGERFIKK